MSGKIYCDGTKASRVKYETWGVVGKALANVVVRSGTVLSAI